jgi:hypothetical protein
MKKTVTSAEIKSQYLKSLSIIEKSNLESEYRIGNKEGKKIINLFKILEKDNALAIEVLASLLENESVKVRICAAAHCLALEIFEEQAVDVLDKISKLNMRILSLEAEMTLKVWREQGSLKVY